MTVALAELRRRALASLIPPARLPLSEWIEGHVRLPEGVSALPGAMRLWPYQRAIADAIGNPTIERVTLVKPVRVGFTSLLTGCLASHVVNDPAPVLVLQPTEADCRDYMCPTSSRCSPPRLPCVACCQATLRIASAIPCCIGASLADP